MRDGSWVHTIRSSDLIIIQIQRTEFTDPNQYFYQYGSQTFSESLQSGHAEILSVFPEPIWNFELNIFMTICIKVLKILKGDDPTVVSSRSTASKLNSASLTCAQQQRHLVGTKTRKLSSCDT